MKREKKREKSGISGGARGNDTLDGIKNYRLLYAPDE